MLEEFGGKMEAEVLDKNNFVESKSEAFQDVEVSLGMEAGAAGAQKQDIQNKKVGRRLLGKSLLFVQRV